MDKAASESRELAQSNQLSAPTKSHHIQFRSGDVGIPAQKQTAGIALNSRDNDPLGFAAASICCHTQCVIGMRSKGSDDWTKEPYLAQLTCARGFKMSDGLRIETDAHYEQKGPGIDLTNWNGPCRPVEQRARNAFR